MQTYSRVDAEVSDWRASSSGLWSAEDTAGFTLVFGEESKDWRGFHHHLPVQRLSSGEYFS